MSQQSFVLTNSMMQWIYNGKSHVLVAGDPLWFTAALGLLLNNDALLQEVQEGRQLSLPETQAPWTIVHHKNNREETLQSHIGAQALEMFVRILSNRKPDEHVQMRNVHGVTLYTTSPNNG